MKNSLNSVAVTLPKRHMHDLSNHHYLSCNMGELIPIYCVECIPGDKAIINCETMVRFAPLTAPVMGMVDVYTHYFFVPWRLLWANFENWITDTLVGGVIPAMPFLTVAGNVSGGRPLLDYLGVPSYGAGTTNKFNCLRLAAYQFIFNEYYRDQNLYNAGAQIVWKCVDGDNIGNWTSLTELRKRAWKRDRFTSALPFAQKGTSVNLPVAGDVTLKSAVGTPGKLRNASAHATIQGAVTGDAAGDLNVNATDSVYDPNGTLEITTATTTISDFRRALALQKHLEKKALGGTRLTEYNLKMYGVKGADSRLQRPEYITGAKTSMQVSEVLNTTGTTGQLPQGNMAGHGIGIMKGQYGKYFCEEQGFIMGIMSVMPRASYQEGFPKDMLKYTDSTEIFNHDFENIGEQGIKNIEVYADNTVNPLANFGYEPRYNEYRYQNDKVSGDFKTTLNQWTWARIFGAIPSLNETFITCDPSHRSFAVTDPSFDKLYVHHFNNVKMVRGISKYGTPSI